MHLVLHLHLHRLCAHAGIFHGGAVRHRVVYHGAVGSFMRRGRNLHANTATRLEQGLKPRDECGDDRHDTPACEFLYEQVPKIWLHQL
jgi:hypothetical protein